MSVFLVAALLGALGQSPVAAEPGSLPEILAPDPRDFALERPDLDFTLVEVDSEQVAPLMANVAWAAPENANLLTRTVAGDEAHLYVFDVYMLGPTQAYSSFSLVDRVTGIATVLASGEARALSDGGISGTSTAIGGASAFHETLPAGVASATTASCKLGCQVATGAATLTFIAICSAVTGYFFAFLCGLASWVGVTGVNKACEIESNSYSCNLLSAGILRPDDIMCDEVSCRVRIHVKNSNASITSMGIGIWWQQKLQPRVYNEWMDQFVRTSPNVPLDVTDYINTFTGSPTSFVMCATALDMSVSFWFDNTTHIGFFLRTTANGVPDNQLYKPINPLPGACPAT